MYCTALYRALRTVCCRLPPVQYNTVCTVLQCTVHSGQCVAAFHTPVKGYTMPYIILYIIYSLGAPPRRAAAPRQLSPPWSAARRSSGRTPHPALLQRATPTLPTLHLTLGIELLPTVGRIRWLPYIQLADSYLCFARTVVCLLHLKLVASSSYGSLLIPPCCA